MPDNQIDVYLPHGSTSFKDMVRITERAGGQVRFFREGGGQVHVAPEAEFDARFRFVDGDELRRLSLIFSPILVDGNWSDGEVQPLPAWSNGTLWNGHATPMFSKETILSAAGDESFRNSWNWTIHDEENDIFLVVSSHEDEMEIDGSTDFTPVLARHAEIGETPSSAFDMEFLGEVREIQVYKPRAIDLENGTTAVGYGIGSYAWTWRDVTDLVIEQQPAPTI